MKTLVFCAKGFETMEFSVFIDVLGWARNDYGYDVPVDTCGFTKEVVSTFNVPIVVDKTIDEISVDEYDALAIPGGFEEFGFYEEAYDERFLQLIRDFDSQKKIIASICVGALPLGKSGILKGRRATTYHLQDAYRQKQLAEFGVNVVNEPVIVDDNIITSYCPETAPQVAFELLRKLTDTKKMETVKSAMGYQVERKNGIKQIRGEKKVERVNKILVDSTYLMYVKKIQEAEKQRVFGHHDLVHFLDVARIAMILNISENYSQDKEMIYTAALLHDIGRWMEYESGVPHEQASVQLAPEIMRKCGYTEDEISEVLTAIGNHRNELIQSEISLSGLIYRADKLSRPCYICEQEKDCHRKVDKKNMKLLW